MEELIAQIAAAHGYPEELVERSAAARAAVSGVGTEEIIRQWAGGEAAAAAPAPAAAAPAAAEAAPAAEPEVPAEPSGPEVEVIAPAAEEAPTEKGEEAAPEAEEAHERHAPEGHPVFAGFPTWLAAAFLIVPALAMTYLLLAPDGPACGTSGQLALNPVTGEAENCDGTPYGVEVFMAFQVGQEVYDARCAACHGAGGGGGAGQVLSGGAILASFPEGQCLPHIEWIALGSAGWPDPTYGALDKPVGGFGQMPGFEGTLTAQELAAVALYERVAFGGQPLPEAEDECGLLEASELAAP